MADTKSQEIRQIIRLVLMHSSGRIGLINGVRAKRVRRTRRGLR